MKLLHRTKTGQGEIGSIGGDQLFEVLTDVLLTLSLTHVNGVDDTPFLIQHLTDSRHLSKSLARQVAGAASRAYQESGGQESRYFPLCAKYLKGA